MRLSGSKSSPKQAPRKVWRTLNRKRRRTITGSARQRKEFNEFSFGAWQKRRERDSVGGYG